MSTPLPPSWLGSLSAGARRFELPLVIGLGLIFVVSGGLYFFAEARRTRFDIHLWAPSTAGVGTRIGVRVVTFDRSSDVPRVLRDRSGRVELTSDTPDAEPLLRRGLDRDAAGGLESTVDVSGVPPGHYRLVARVDGLGQVSRTLRIENTTVRPRAHERPTLPLQAFTVLPVQPVDDAEPPGVLEPRVVGGACAPLVPCEVLVRVGEPGAAVRLAPTGAFEPSPEPRPGRPPPSQWLESTEGIVSFVGLPRGADVELTIEAARDGTPVASRVFRLPMVHGATLARIEGQRERTRLITTAPAETPVYVDLFSNGQWVGATSLLSDDNGVLLSELVDSSAERDSRRLQLRLDPFSASNAVTRILGPTDSEQARFQRALDELTVFDLPSAASSLQQRADSLRQSRDRIRWLATGATALAGVSAIALLLNRGRLGIGYARRVQQGTDVEHRSSLRLWTVLALVVFVVAVAFAVIGLWFAWRTGLF